MQIIRKPLVTATGVPVEIHAVLAVRTVRNPASGSSVSMVIVGSWPTVAAMLAGTTALDTRNVPITPPPGSELGEGAFWWASMMLVEDQESPLAGGSVEVVSLPLASLEAAREAAWERVKAWRHAAIHEDLQTPYGAFQARAEDQRNIMGAIMAAQAMQAAGMPGAVDWTLADNSVVTLEPQQLLEVGMLLMARTQDAHARGRVLRQAVNDAQTVAELEILTWAAA